MWKTLLSGSEHLSITEITRNSSKRFNLSDYNRCAKSFQSYIIVCKPSFYWVIFYTFTKRRKRCVLKWVRLPHAKDTGLCVGCFVVHVLLRAMLLLSVETGVKTAAGSHWADLPDVPPLWAFLQHLTKFHSVRCWEIWLFSSFFPKIF